MEKEWFPSLEEYNPGITKEQWIEFVQDKNIFNENSLITFACIQKAKVATCADMAEEFGRNTDFYKSNLWRTCERIYKKINCPLSEREEGGNRFWSVCCLGRYLTNGRFEFKIRPELQKAFEETGILEGIEVMEGKNIFKKVVNTNGIYSCDELDITVEEWKKVLQDSLVYNNYKLWLARFYQEVEHKATCKYMGEKYKCSSQTPNSVITKFGIAARKILNRFEVQGTDGSQTYWVIPMKKGQTVNGAFEWTMRDELVQAMEELGMTDPSKFEKNINFWSGGIYWGEEKKLDEFSNNDYWQIGWKKDSVNKSAIESWKNIQKIQIGDLLSFHGYGGKNDLTIYQISKVIDKNEDEGKLIIEKINKKDDILFHDKAPKMEKGGWFGTLFQVTGEEAINKIFGNYIQGDPQMTQENSLVSKYTDLLRNTKNIILTGAPGTGKTFMAKQIAKELGCEDDNIGFVQFHPSYDYTDFVEGLRPTDKDGNGNVGFERKDGVFKEFCEKALENLVETPLNNDESQNFDEAWEKLLDEVRENIASGKLTKIGIWEYGLSSTNSLKYESTDTQSKYTFTITKKNVFDAYRGIKARPSGYFQKYMKEVADYMKKYGLKEYKEKSGPEKEKKSLKNFVFIIDEINRGEVAKIFGELFYSVDPGYRVTSDDLNAIKNGNKTITTIKTQYANLETEGNEFDKVLQKKEKDFGHFFIPENVYIIGTMNDIDRSVESMDFAFRRRFSWIEVKASDTVDMLDPKYDDNGELIAGLEKDLAEKAKHRMKNLNAAIWNEKEKKGIEGLNEAYHIGASYFLKLNNYDGSQEKRFESLWEYHIKGILQEYLRGNPNGKLEDLKAAYDKKE